MMNKVIEKGKELAFLLRHDADSFEKGLIDKNGWRQVSELVKHHGYTKALLDEIVETNNKQRYEYSPDKRRIRARQGHSIHVDVELKEATPPDIGATDKPCGGV
jgi:putative RNA 2'-phosphotransferase